MNQRQKTKKKLETSTVLNFINKLKLSENICFVVIMPTDKNQISTDIDIVVGIKFIDEWKSIQEMMSLRKKFESVFRNKATLFYFPNSISEPTTQDCKDTLELIQRNKSNLSNHEIHLYEPNQI